MNNFAEEILNQYIELTDIEAIAIGGSTTAKTSDKISDIDIYIFSKTNVPIEIRENIIKPIFSKFEIGCEYFGSGDEYFVDKLNRQFDVMYWECRMV